MSKLREFLGHLANSILVKLITSYSLIILLILAIITAMLSVRYSEVLKQYEINYENQIVQRVSESVDRDIDAAKGIIQQIYMDNDVRSSFFNFLNADSRTIDIDYVMQLNKFRNLMSVKVSEKNAVLDIILVKNRTGEVFYFSSGVRRIVENYDFSRYEWFGRAAYANGILRMVPAYYPEYIRNENKPVYSACAGFFGAGNELIGTIIMNFDAQGIERAYAEYRDEVKGYILVLGGAGEVFYDSTGRYYGTEYPYFGRLQEGGSAARLESESIVASRRGGSGLTAYGIVPRDAVMKDINLIHNTMYLFMAVCVAVSILLIYTASVYFSKRIQQVVKAMRGVEKGDLKSRIRTGRGHDEVEEIGRVFNSMCGELERHINEVYLAEIKAKDAQLQALQTQINPHFLYNTLEAIRMKAVMSRNEDVGDMIFMLADLFKRSAQNGGREVAVREELEYIRYYLELHRIRLGERLAAEFDVDPGIYRCRMLKFTLQPLLENALEHGGLGEGLKCLTIRVEGREGNGVLALSVKDDGTGMEERELETVRERIAGRLPYEGGGGIGLRNIHERIVLAYGEGYGLSIDSRKGAWTRVTMRIPARGPEEPEKQCTG